MDVDDRESCTLEVSVSFVREDRRHDCVDADVVRGSA